MRLEGITDIVNPSCGDNPCSWIDNVYVRDPCLNFLECADPSNILVTGATKGAGAAVGQAVGQTASGAGSGFLSGLSQNPVGSGVVVLGGVLALIVVLEVLRR